MNSVPITRDPAFDESDLGEIYPMVYDELRRLASYYMRRERSEHTLQPTALVHEAFLRLNKEQPARYATRTEFIRIAANMMRHILVNHAVHRKRQKREGTFVRITLDRAVDQFYEKELDLLALDQALRNLARLDERQARIFELRFFGGLTVEETAEILDISAATVKREWTIAKLYLQRELFGDKK